MVKFKALQCLQTVSLQGVRRAQPPPPPPRGSGRTGFLKQSEQDGSEAVSGWERGLSNEI